MRLIRTILVVSGAGFLLPSPPEQISASSATALTEQVSTLAMLSSASSAVTDVAGFCSRQPEFCGSAAYVAGKLEAKAKYSVKLLYEWAAEPSGPAVEEITISPEEPAATKADMLKTGTTLADQGVTPGPLQAKSQSTLKLEDLIPEWRGPLDPRQAPKKQG